MLGEQIDHSSLRTR